MSFVDLSRFLGEQLQIPIVKQDEKLRLWCLIAKGYTDIEIDYRVSKRDWLEAQDIAKSLAKANGSRARPVNWASLHFWRESRTSRAVAGQCTAFDDG